MARFRKGKKAFIKYVKSYGYTKKWKYVPPRKLVIRYGIFMGGSYIQKTQSFSW